MDRQIVYPGSIPLDTDVLNVQRNVLKAIGYLAQATLGQSTVVDGLACTPQTVPNMTVNIGPGSILALSTIDATAFGSLALDTSDPLVKMGINASTVLSSTFGTIAAPSTSGQSINYLVEAAFQESDATPVVLPYYNASNPASAYSGPSNSGTPQNTQRLQSVNLLLKSGSPATTGSQVTPTPDSGFVGLWVITVAYAQTTITAGNISRYSAAPLANEQTGTGARSGRLLNIQYFTTPGTATYTPSLGTTKILAIVQAAGSAGGGAPATGAGQTSQGAPGAGGAWAQKTLLLSTTGVSGATVTIGAGGTSAAGAGGTAGGSSSFGSFVSANGGQASLVQAATSTAIYSIPTTSGGTAGSSGDVNSAGQRGGGSVNAGGAGINASPGLGWVPGYGSGGGGTNNPASASAQTGGAGQGGCVEVWEFS